ncbi:MAG: TetR/AcrR family transcriptional regulator [Desulfopila sp.]
MSKRRMTGEARKAEITLAARAQFAQKGFYGTSIRDIARGAGVSEALIYKHFPSKEALYNEINFYIESQIEKLGDYFAGQAPSTATLVHMVYALTGMILTEMPGRSDEQKFFERLLAYSLLENTTFAKLVFLQYERSLMPLWRQSIDVAQDTGDMHMPIIDSAVKMWLTHHLSMAINFLHLSGEFLFPYSSSLDDLHNGIVIFIMRGIGLKDEVIRHYIEQENSKDIIRDIFSQ